MPGDDLIDPSPSTTFQHLDATTEEPAELDSEVEGAEVECDLYVLDQAQCEANGCVYVTELDGEVSCEEPELEAGEVAEPGEAAEEAAEAGIFKIHIDLHINLYSERLQNLQKIPVQEIFDQTQSLPSKV